MVAAQGYTGKHIDRGESIQIKSTFYNGGNKRGGKRDRANEMVPNETNMTTWQTFEDTSLYKHGYRGGHAD